MGVSILLVAIGLLVLSGLFVSQWLVLTFALAFAVGYATWSPLGPSAATDIFRGRNLGSILGFLGSASGLGSALGAWVAGYIFDVTGSYYAAFALSAGSTAAGAACMWLAAPRLVRRVAGRRGQGL